MSVTGRSTDPTTWGVSSLQLQRPANLYFDGAVRPWEDGVLHVSTEAVVRGLNVFEGLKGYWQDSDEFAFRTLRSHYDRMRRSARVLHIPVDFSYEHFVRACSELARAELSENHDLYIRATLFVVEGHYGEGTVSDLVLTAYQQKMEPPKAVAVGTSTWQRSPDLSMPARVKTSANYLIARLARFEGKSRGYDDMILLNQYGRVAEGISACVLLVRDGIVSAPPASEGAIESITLRILVELAKEDGIPFERRPIDRSELYVADEVALTGTLAEITPIVAIDDRSLPAESSLLAQLKDRYLQAMRGIRPHSAAPMTVVSRDDA